MKKHNIFANKPVETNKIVLHSCCAPCSTGLVDGLLEHNIIPVIFYFNPNIYPFEEYEIRKSENKRYALSLGLEFIDADNDRSQWKEQTWDLRKEPEKGARCLLCFKIRLTETARFAKKKWLLVICYHPSYFSLEKP
jgi:predicted adenine nucleotide alpha hydrolase (AANH) superfamily ATPase